MKGFLDILRRAGDKIKDVMGRAGRAIRTVLRGLWNARNETLDELSEARTRFSRLKDEIHRAHAETGEWSDELFEQLRDVQQELDRLRRKSRGMDG